MCTEREPDHAESLVANYLKEKLLIKVDGEAMPFDYLGKEISDDLIATWCYLEILDVKLKKLLLVEGY